MRRHLNCFPTKHPKGGHGCACPEDRTKSLGPHDGRQVVTARRQITAITHPTNDPVKTSDIGLQAGSQVLRAHPSLPRRRAKAGLHTASHHHPTVCPWPSWGLRALVMQGLGWACALSVPPWRSEVQENSVETTGGCALGTVCPDPPLAGRSLQQ